jgi:hypothetical protein
MISFEREILATLRRRNPDLLNAFVCLGLAAGADGVVTMTAPGPLAHVPHKRRAGMISALAAAGHLKRVPGGYLVHGVSSEATGVGQAEDTEPTAAREALHCNTFQNNDGWTEVEQEEGNKEASQEDGILEDVAELAFGEQWEELPLKGGREVTDDRQAEDTEATVAHEASHCNASQDNSGGTVGQQWHNMRDIDALESLLDGIASKGLAEPERDTDAFIDISDIDEPQPAAPVIGMGLRRPPVAVSPVPAPAADNEARVEARAREMALEDWDVTDARTFETCQGDFDQFWTYRKRHFLAQARQELGLAGS